MMKDEGHAQLVRIRVGIANASFSRPATRRHLATIAVDASSIPESWLNQLFKVLVHVRAIPGQGAACAAITGDVLDDLGL